MDLKRIFKFKLKQIVGIRAYALSLSVYGCVPGVFMAKLTNSYCVYTSYTEKCRKNTKGTEQKASMDSMFFSRF